MSPSLKAIKRQALELTPEEREMLANHLLRSLNDAPLSSMDELWVNEAERRYQHFKAGMTEAIPEDKIFSQIREELRWPT